MAVYCPIYDPVYGWYILVCGPNGFKKQLITSPLYYYYSLGVKPPIGSNFTQDDYDDFEMDLISLESIPPSLPSIYSPTMVPSSSIVSQTTAALEPELGDYLGGFKTALSQSTLVPVYSASLPTSASKFSGIGISESNKLVQYLDFPCPFLCPTGHPSSLSSTYDIGSFLQSSPLLPAYTSSKDNYSNLSPSSSTSYFPQSTESNDFKSKYSNLQSSSTPHLPSPSMTTGFKYNNSNVKPLTTSHPFQLSKLSGTQQKYDCVPTSMPCAPQIPMSSALKFDNTGLHATSASSAMSYHLDYLPPTPSGVGKALPPIGTPCPHVASATTSSVKINENVMSPEIYDDPYLDEAMYLDGIDDSLLYQEEEDYEMSEYF